MAGYLKEAFIPPRDRRKISTGRPRGKTSEFFDNGIGSDVFWDQPIIRKKING